MEVAKLAVERQMEWRWTYCLPARSVCWPFEHPASTMNGSL